MKTAVPEGETRRVRMYDTAYVVTPGALVKCPDGIGRYVKGMGTDDRIRVAEELKSGRVPVPVEKGSGSRPEPDDFVLRPQNLHTFPIKLCFGSDASVVYVGKGGHAPTYFTWSADGKCVKTEGDSTKGVVVARPTMETYKLGTSEGVKVFILKDGVVNEVDSTFVTKEVSKYRAGLGKRDILEDVGRKLDFVTKAFKTADDDAVRSVISALMTALFRPDGELGRGQSVTFFVGENAVRVGWKRLRDVVLKVTFDVVAVGR